MRALAVASIYVSGKPQYKTSLRILSLGNPFGYVYIYMVVRIERIARRESIHSHTYA